MIIARSALSVRELVKTRMLFCPFCSESNYFLRAGNRGWTPPVDLGVLTHRFFSFRKKTARSCPRGGIGRLVTIFGSLFWHFFELLKNKVLTWSGVGPSKSGRSDDFLCCSQGRIHQFRRLRAPAVHGVSSYYKIERTTQQAMTY